VFWRFHQALGCVLAAVDTLLAALTCSLLAFVVAANAWEIALRAIANQSLHWLYEVNLLLANWIYFLGICLIYWRQRDIAIDFLVDQLPAGPRRVYQSLINLLVIGVLAVIAWYGTELMRLQAPDYSMGVGIWNPLFTLPVVLGAVLMALAVLYHTLSLWLSDRRPAAQ
jgi:TRAP-type C4-dicarboxylate transport system permease small subunit